MPITTIRDILAPLRDDVRNNRSSTYPIKGSAKAKSIRTLDSELTRQTVGPNVQAPSIDATTVSDALNAPPTCLAAAPRRRDPCHKMRRVGAAAKL